MNGSNIAGGNPKNGRVENDYYATNPKDTQAFLDLITKEYEMNLDGIQILEPAAGEGHISKVLKDNFPHALVLSTDLVQRGNEDIRGGVDFLNSFNEEVKFDYVITNPPFKLAKEFVDKALTVSDKVFIFAKLQFLEGVQRKEWFEQQPLKYVYVYSFRANPWRNGQPLDPNGKKWASTMAFAWYVFDKSYEGEPVIRWI